ncbi:MAG: exodeoxyribonuclease VII small subunit [Victivallales bacterium]|nr:exodeoxyribonuclease VII small subunit [Victivallales bacterium]
MEEKQKAKEEKQEIKFEEALARLEAIVAQLENGGLSLEESMAQFEEGMRLNKLCQAKLKEAEQKIERLVRKDDGSLEWQQKS